MRNEYIRGTLKVDMFGPNNVRQSMLCGQTGAGDAVDRKKKTRKPKKSCLDMMKGAHARRVKRKCVT